MGKKFFIACAVGSQISYGAVVVGTDHVRVESGSPFSITFSIDQEFTASNPGDGKDFTGFGFEHLGGSSFRFEGSLLDEGVTVYRTNSFGDFQEANLNNFEELVFGQSYDFSREVLAFRTPAKNEPSPTGVYGYGWVSVFDGGGTLGIINHAVAYGPLGSGIQLQTTNAIPEPTVPFLGALSIGWLGLLRRRSI